MPATFEFPSCPGASAFDVSKPVERMVPCECPMMDMTSRISKVAINSSWKVTGWSQAKLFLPFQRQDLQEVHLQKQP